MSDTDNPEAGSVVTEESVVDRLAGLMERPEAPTEEPNEHPAEASEEAEAEPGEDEPDEGAETATEEPEEPEEPQRYRVKVGGEELEVTLEEALSGYAKDADYRRKTAALAEDRRTVEAEREQLQAERQHYAQQIQQFLQALPQEQEPDWVQLAQEDPAGYVATKAQWEARQQQRAKAYQEYQQLTQTQMREHLQREDAKLATLIPDWSDAEKRKTETGKMAEHAMKSFGFTPQEVSSVHDARLVNVLRKAWLYDQAQAAKPPALKKVAEAPKVQKPGNQPTKKQEEADRRAAMRDRARRTGNDADAVAYLLGGR